MKEREEWEARIEEINAAHEEELRRIRQNVFAKSGGVSAAETVLKDQLDAANHATTEARTAHAQTKEELAEVSKQLEHAMSTVSSLKSRLVETEGRSEKLHAELAQAREQ